MNASSRFRFGDSKKGPPLREGDARPPSDPGVIAKPKIGLVGEKRLDPSPGVKLGVCSENGVNGMVGETLELGTSSFGISKGGGIFFPSLDGTGGSKSSN